ncbi:DUF2651 family protein [Thalassobacillus sp. C254]|uniref:DUF2651 family protein n=1 Tax=Thalassobacillus sp. C254 TaxID=1225341 RepID=UPI0018DC0443|nr:DUF2651 family protein [Thalassobacillus sp. C254]
MADLQILFPFLPFFIFAVSVYGTAKLKRFYIMPLAVLIIFPIVSNMLFHTINLPWVIFYTGLSLLASFITWSLRYRFQQKVQNMSEAQRRLP